MRTEAGVGRSEDVISGRNAVAEALKSGRPIDSVLVARGNRPGSIGVLIAKCRDAGVPVKDADPRKLEAMGGPNHQGIIAIAACKEYATLEDLFVRAAESGEEPLFIVCDELEDPHNLGAIVRTAEAVGAHGVIVPKRRSVGLTSTVYKASAGAVEYMPVARVSNMANTIRDLKKAGVWVYGTAADGEVDLYHADLKGPAAIVIGNEGQGMSRLVAESCDQLVRIPMKGSISSLNASAAASILLYEAVRQRNL